MNEKGSGSGDSLGAAAGRMGLDTSLLYETIIRLANEGLLTSRCVNAAADILLNELGLPEYYFRNISQDALRRILHVIATNMQERDGRFVLSDRTAYLECHMDGDIQILMATPETRDHMERMIGESMSRRRWEYYYSEEYTHYTYLIRPDECADLKAIRAGASPFAFARDREQNLFVPEETRHRYESFLEKHRASATRPVEFSEAAGGLETRIMFHKNIFRRSLPLIRKLLADHGLRLARAYGETYRTDLDQIASVCSFYVKGPVDSDCRERLTRDLRSFLALAQNAFPDLYIEGRLDFREMLFAVCAGFFVHQFIFRNSETDRQIMANLPRKEWQDAMAKRIAEANHSEYSRQVITDAMRENPDLIRELFCLFDQKFNPQRSDRLAASEIQRRTRSFADHLDSRFIDDVTALEIFRFMARLVADTLKCNFYKAEKRSFAFRLPGDILDPVVFQGGVFGIFFVLGHYSVGTHMRAEDISRGGLRLLRVTPLNYENELDDANLLNFALGPRAQRLKHKDIAESGSKGVIVPTPVHAADGLNAVYDYSDGIMDLIFPCPEVVDHYGRPEMIFFGPDEGTAGLMDRVAARARERGYRHWRTFTTGKEIGLPHDAYGLTVDGRLFALMGQGSAGTELEVEGVSVATSADTEDLLHALGAEIEISGMTTAGVMSSFRELIGRKGCREEELKLMMTGGPDGDLGANQIQCYKGPICLVVDGGSVLFDPDGLDKHELRRLALNRHLHPRLNTSAYPREKLGPRGFMVERTAKNVRLPNGAVVEDGAYFHKTFLTDPKNRDFIKEAGLRAFIPCGGFKDTINFSNVRKFLELFKELEFIVEGANVFFDDTARETIAAESGILQIRDSTANKGGVTSSSIAEVLTGFLLGDDYEAFLVDHPANRFRLARETLEIIVRNARAETQMLLNLYEQDPRVPLYRLSVQTSEQLLAFQAMLLSRIDEVLGDEDLVEQTLRAYIPAVLIDLLGMPAILKMLCGEELAAYRNAMVTKKLAAVGTYRHAVDWPSFIERANRDLPNVLRRLKDELHAPRPSGSD